MFTFSNMGDLNRIFKDTHDWAELVMAACAQSAFPMANLNFCKLGNTFRLAFDACEICTSKEQIQEFLTLVKSVTQSIVDKMALSSSKM